MQDGEMRAMLIDYMEKGFLDNIIAMFKQDQSLNRFIADLIGDEQIRVRLGGTALVEELVREHREGLSLAVPGLIALLKAGSPTIRGDAASVLGIIGDRSAQAALEACSRDDLHPGVRAAAGEALLELGKRD